MLESDIQQQVVEFCRLHEQRCNFLFFSVANEAMGRSKSGAGIGRMMRLKRMGLRSGVADLVFVKYGRAYFLELKAAKGVMSDTQKMFQMDAWRVDSFYSVAHSFEEAENTLRLWRIVE